jgi:hypothetical protein
MTPAEHAAAAALLQQDPDAAVIKMTATGNPDFIVIPKAAVGLVRFVEVKAGKDKVHQHQKDVHGNLRAKGFQVDVVRLSGAPHHNDVPEVRCEACGEYCCVVGGQGECDEEALAEHLLKQWLKKKAL